MTEIHIPNFDEDDDLPLPVFPSKHSASSSLDSASSPTTPGGSHSKRSASPFLRRKKNRTDSIESSSTALPKSAAGAFSFPHNDNSQHLPHPGSPTTVLGHSSQPAGNTSLHSPARPTFKQRSASSTLPQQPQYLKQYSRNHAYNNEPASSTSTTSSSNASTPWTPHGTSAAHAEVATGSGKSSRHGHGNSGYAGLASNPSAMDSTTSLSSLPPNSPYAGAQYAQSQLNQSIGPASPGMYTNLAQGQHEKYDRPALPAKKGSFMNLKNAFKAATSGKSSSSSALAAVASAKLSASGSSGVASPPSLSGGNRSYNPNHVAPSSQISQPNIPNVEGNNYPALRNPFNRSYSSNALPGPSHSSFNTHGPKNANAGSASGLSLRTVERSGSGPTGLLMNVGPGSSSNGAKSTLGGKMYRVKDKVGPAGNQAGSMSGGAQRVGPSNGSGSGSVSGSGSGSGSKMIRHRQQASIATASSIGSGSVGSRYHTSSSGVERVKEEVEVDSDAGGFGAAMRRGLGSASGLASIGVGKRSSHGYSSSDHHYQMSKSSHGDHAHAQASARSIDNFVIPEPRSPGEIVLHELLRHFASRSNDKIEFLLDQPLFSAQSAGLGIISEGKDVAYDDLLRSLGAIAKDFPRQVVDFVINWGQNQDRAGVDALSGALEGRMREVMLLLNEKRILATRYTVYRTLLEITRQHAKFEKELAAELEESVFEVYALDDSPQPMLNSDRLLVSEVTFALLGSLGSIGSSQVIERFLTRLANLLQNPDAVGESSARTSLQHLLKGLISLPDSIILADPGTLGTLGMLFAHSSSIGVREAFAQELETLLRRMENFSKSALEPFEQAIKTISSQADRLGAEPGLWSAAFSLSVTALRLVSDDEFNRTWQFRLDQAVGMLKSPQHQAFHKQALTGIFRIVQGFAHRQTIQGGSGEALHAVLRHIIPDSGKSEMEGLLSLITASLAVMESDETLSTTKPFQAATQRAPQVTNHHDDTTMRIRTIATAKPPTEDAEVSRTFASGNLPHDDTLGDLVGTLHQLNQFFTEDEGDDYDHQMTTPIRPDRMQMNRTAQSRGASISSNEWDNSRNNSLASPIDSTRGEPIGQHHPTRSREFGTSSDSDGLANDDDDTLSPQASAWRYTGVASRHRVQQSTSSAGSGQRGKGVFDLEEDISPDYTPLRETPRQAISTLMAGQQRKPGQLRALMLGNGASAVL